MEERSSPVRELLRLPDFLRLWLVGAFANAMRWLELLASGLFAYEVTGSALAVTFVVAVRQLPQLAFGAFLGAVSEAVNRKLIVMLALVGPAFVSTVLASLATTGHLALWHVALGNLISGTMWATEMSTRRRMVGEVAGRTGSSTPSRSIGDQRRHPHDRPLLGGIAFQWLGMKGAYTLTALVQFFGAFAMAGWSIRRSREGSTWQNPGGDRRGYRLRPHQAHHPAGVRHHHRHQRLRLRLFRPGGAVGPVGVRRLASPWSACWPPPSRSARFWVVR